MPLLPYVPKLDQIFSFYLHDLMTGLLFFGSLLLAIALYFVYKLAKELPKGRNRSWWKLLAGLILLFICGYFGFYWTKS